MSWRPTGLFLGDQYADDKVTGADCPELEQKLKLLHKNGL